jgi:hypothetical protein
LVDGIHQRIIDWMRAVHYLHINDYVHQDIHQGNVFTAFLKDELLKDGPTPPPPHLRARRPRRRAGSERSCPQPAGDQITTETALPNGREYGPVSATSIVQRAARYLLSIYIPAPKWVQMRQLNPV